MNSHEQREHLFVYGTLRSEFPQNRFHRLLKPAAVYLGPGSFPGRLFDLGGYPGAIFDPQSENRVFGELYALLPSRQSALLAALDEYEDCTAQPPEYRREKIPVHFQEETLPAWTYLLAIPTAGLTAIPSGNYIAYLQKFGWI